jgi:hypothetical protein
MKVLVIGYEKGSRPLSPFSLQNEIPINQEGGDRNEKLISHHHGAACYRSLRFWMLTADVGQGAGWVTLLMAPTRGPWTTGTDQDANRRAEDGTVVADKGKGGICP